MRCDATGCSLGACQVRALWANPLPILESARIIPRIVDGQANGFKIFGVRPSSFFGQLGIQNGDVAKRLNGRDLNDPTSALAAIDGIRNAETINIDLERQGQPIQRVVRIDRRPLRDDECPPLPAAAPAPIEKRPITADEPPKHPPIPGPSSKELLRDLEKDIVCTGNTCVLKHGIFDRILEQPSLVQQGVRIVPVVKAGQPSGLRLYAIRPDSLFARLLFRNGDTIQQLAGYDVSSPEKALTAYTVVRSLPTIPVQIERAGKPLTLTYQIQR